MSAWIASVARRSPRRLTAWTRMASGRLRSPAACSSRRTEGVVWICWSALRAARRTFSLASASAAMIGPQARSSALDAEGGDDADADRFGLIGLKGFEEGFQRGFVLGREERGGRGGALLRVVGAEQARPFGDLFLADPLAESRERATEDQEGDQTEPASGAWETLKSSADERREYRARRIVESRIPKPECRRSALCQARRRTRSSSSFILAAAPATAESQSGGVCGRSGRR